jgi:hypothetical protein
MNRAGDHDRQATPAWMLEVGAAEPGYLLSP